MNDLETKKDVNATKLQETAEFEALKDKVKDLEKKLNDTAADLQQTTESINQVKHQQQDQSGTTTVDNMVVGVRGVISVMD